MTSDPLAIPCTYAQVLRTKLYEVQSFTRLAYLQCLVPCNEALRIMYNACKIATVWLYQIRRSFHASIMFTMPTLYLCHTEGLGRPRPSRRNADSLDLMTTIVLLVCLRHQNCLALLRLVILHLVL
jgi:hypothetical protein